jgi:uncharacterized phage protein gp47/JayE
VNNDWGLTARGFRRPNYAELLDALEYKARELFGTGANLTVRSPLGMFCRIFAWMLSLLFSVLEDVYNSRFVDTAVGTSLYNLGRTIGLRLLSNQRATGYLLITGQPDVLIPAGWLASTTEGVVFAVVTQGIIDENSEVLLPAQAVNAGEEGNAGVGKINTIVNPIVPSAVDKVTNPEAFTGGRLRETDEEYRARYYKSVDFVGGVNKDAIRAEILQNVEGVKSAEVYENDTDLTDANGLPPHSIEAVVYGGTDGAIAQAIFRRKAAGIQTSGNIFIPVVTQSGANYSIRFSRPAPTNVWFKIWGISKKSDSLKTDAQLQTEITRILLDFIGTDTNFGLGIGENVYYKRVVSAIYTVSDVLDFKLKLSATGNTWSYTNIHIDGRHKAVTDEEKVIFDAP